MLLKKLNILIITLTIGFFMLPTLSYSCATKTENKCCKKEISSKAEKKDCCKNKNSKDNDNGCGGKCGHSNCTTSTLVNFSIISSCDINFKNNSLDLSFEKPKFHHSETFISSGYTSVWLPPKIK